MQDMKNPVKHLCFYSFWKIRNAVRFPLTLLFSLRLASVGGGCCTGDLDCFGISFARFSYLVLASERRRKLCSPSVGFGCFLWLAVVVSGQLFGPL